MWYHNRKPINVCPPSRVQRLTLRLMICIGLLSAGLFLYSVWSHEHKGYAPLYYLLLFTFSFLVFKVFYEWYHYWSINRPAVPATTPKLSVDVLTTFVPGEPYEMILETLEAIQQIRYPHTTYLCDEGNDPYLKSECERLGVVHVTRKEKVNAKAGNINNALRQASGDVCLVLDPDHVPAPDFLDKVLPHFADEKVGFVQVVQAYRNFKESLVAKGSAQQTYQFYGPMMMCMHSYGTAQAIGANCCFRRKALDSIGGHAPGLAEDMNTSMKLHAQGWRSVYVPEVVARGFVPTTISAYYKQQLKWSRGVFELLVTTFISHFKGFSLRQKIHYSLLPWHYFNGVIYFINFMIPILALTLGLMPMTMDFSRFLIVSVPFMASTLIIRHYVQRWVMEEMERGTHLLGGVLLIGSWWIHSLGIIYTILRKKVPYDPTPKDGKEEKTLGVTLPNILILLLSVGAIVFGLNRDLNPFSIIMAMFAGINALILGANFLIAYQWRIRKLKKKHRWLKGITGVYTSAKTPFWRFRHSVYSYLRIAALPIILLVLGSLYFYSNSTEIENLEFTELQPSEEQHYIGYYHPRGNAGLTDLGQLDSLSSETGIQPGIISSYWAWQPADSAEFPRQHFEEIYKKEAFPMLSWEPWLSTFPRWDSLDKQSYLQAIHQGYFDDYIRHSARQLASLERPIFLRFAHEPDNPAYPWFSEHPSAAEHYIKAWRHLHSLFQEENAQNVIWVYNPWLAENADAYFPGPEYVDWLGVTALNYGPHNTEVAWQSFESIYQPFHRALSFKYNLPVMLAEFGSLASADAQRNQEWFEEANKVLQERFEEIKAVVFFAAPADQNLATLQGGQSLNWQKNSQFFNVLGSWSNSHLQPERLETPGEVQVSQEHRSFYDSIRGVNYNPGLDWRHSKHPLFKRKVAEDLRAIKAAGLSTILRFGPSVYDHNILSAATEVDLPLIYGLWLPKGINWLEDSLRTSELKEDLLDHIGRHAQHPMIKAWHLAPDVFEQIRRSYPPPASYSQEEAYLNWLSDLVSQISQLSSKPVSIELKNDPRLIRRAEALAINAPEIDGFGIELNELNYKRDSLNLPRPYFISKYRDNDLEQMDPFAEPGVYANWQDDIYDEGISLDGLLNLDGLPTKAYRKLHAQLHPDEVIDSVPEVSVLVPAVMPAVGAILRFHALERLPEQSWAKATERSKLDYSWHLIKMDDLGNTFARKELSNGPVLDLRVPAEPHRYMVMLSAELNGQSIEKMVRISNPVYYGEEFQKLSRDQADFHLKESRK